MKINTKTKILNLKGEEILDQDKNAITIGYYLSEILLLDKTAGKMKAFILAQKFATTDEVEVDSADLTMIKNAVEKNESFNNLILGQLLVLLEDIKESK